MSVSIAGYTLQESLAVRSARRIRIVRMSKQVESTSFPVRVSALGLEREYNITLRVSPKGAVSLYGLGRFPVSQYPFQWLAILGVAKQIEEFIREYKGAVKWAK
jgi:hypothetical protein